MACNPVLRRENRKPLHALDGWRVAHIIVRASCVRTAEPAHVSCTEHVMAEQSQVRDEPFEITLRYSYLETESELSCGSPDFDLITEVSDAVCEPGCGFGRVAAGEVLGAEVLVVSAVTQHVVDNRQDRCGHRDGRLLGTAACFETQELSLQIAILLARRAPGGLQQYRLEPRCALFDPRRAALAGALVKARNESRP